MAHGPLFYVYRDAKKQWRWRFRASNGEIIAVSSESYVRREDCEHGIELIKREGPKAPVIRERV